MRAVSLCIRPCDRKIHQSPRSVTRWGGDFFCFFFAVNDELLRPVFQHQIELISKNLKIHDVVRDEDKIVGNCDGGNLRVQDGGGFPDGKKTAGNVSVDGCGVDVVGDYRKRGLNIIIQERKQLVFFRALWQ